MGKGKADFWIKLADCFELPSELLVDFPCVFTIGNQQAYIFNHQGLLEYKKEKIGLRLKKGKITLEGENFMITEIAREKIVVSGKITGISFQGGKEK